MGQMNPKSPGPSQVHISFNAIDSGLREETLQFRLVHFWEARNPTKGGLLIGLELLMIDKKDKVTKQTVMERALTEQLKERQEMERKLQKLAKTMDYLERAKREEAAPLIEAYQRRLLEEREFYEREQQREVQLSRERHESISSCI